MKWSEENELAMSGKKLMRVLTEDRGPPQLAGVLCMGYSFTSGVSKKGDGLLLM